MATCYKCEKPCDEDTYCYGCREHICEKCCKEDPWGTHEPEDHYETDEDEEPEED